MSQDDLESIERAARNGVGHEGFLKLAVDSRIPRPPVLNDTANPTVIIGVGNVFEDARKELVP